MLKTGIIMLTIEDLILDDSTSAVDTATDAKIRAALREAIPGTTKIIIAQRISSIQDADRIIVMNDGQIEGFGTHDELPVPPKIPMVSPDLISRLMLSRIGASEEVE